MSLKTWMKEFYPVFAHEDEALEAPAAHSLRKWIGLRQDNIDKHNLKLHGRYIQEIRAPVKRFAITGESCALCEAYYIEGCEGAEGCEHCPLYILRDGFPCDQETPEEEREDRNSPYFEFLTDQDPEPMITLLLKAEAMESAS